MDGRWGGGWGGVEGVGGGLNPPVNTFGLAVGQRSILTGHRGPLEGITDAFTQLQKTIVLLVLPTGPKSHVMNTRGLDRAKNQPCKKADLARYTCSISVP